MEHPFGTGGLASRSKWKGDRKKGQSSKGRRRPRRSASTSHVSSNCCAVPVRQDCTTRTPSLSTAWHTIPQGSWVNKSQGRVRADCTYLPRLVICGNTHAEM